MSYSDYNRFLSLPRFSIWGSYGKIRDADFEGGHESELFSLVGNPTSSCIHDFVITNDSSDGNDFTPCNDVSCCMVCDKYFTKEDHPDQNCWSCGHVVCDTCTNNLIPAQNDATVKNVLLCLHCDFGKSPVGKDKECLCLFCQRVNGEEFAPENSFIVMDHENHERR